jgi:hypothetical protein
MLNRDVQVGHPEVSETDIHIHERGKGLVFEDALQGVQAGKRVVRLRRKLIKFWIH